MQLFTDFVMDALVHCHFVNLSYNSMHTLVRGLCIDSLCGSLSSFNGYLGMLSSLSSYYI